MLVHINKILLPFGFILLYGSGFVFTAFGLQNSSAMAFLSTRFFIAFLILVAIALIIKATWPKSIKEFFHISTAGALTVGTFSIGVFLAIDFGVSASLSALIIALQPIVVTFLAVKYLNEEFNKKILLGLFLGVFGVLFIVFEKIQFNQQEIIGVAFSFIALLGLSFGNIYQKKYCQNMNLFSGGAIQTFSSTILALPLLLFYEDAMINFNTDFIIALFYMTVCVSIGALSLLYVMIEKGEVSKVASIFYLMPVCASVIGYFVLGENIDIYIFVGILFVLLSIVLINWKKEN